MRTYINAHVCEIRARVRVFFLSKRRRKSSRVPAKLKRVIKFYREGEASCVLWEMKVFLGGGGRGEEMEKAVVMKCVMNDLAN